MPKLLLVSPVVALFSFIAPTLGLQFDRLEKPISELIILGQIPGTEVYLSFDQIFVASISIVWSLIVWRLLRIATRLIPQNESHLNYIESVAL